MKPLRILFKFPCRGRREMFFESLNSLDRNIRDRVNYHISLTLDKDDDILNTEEVIEKIKTYNNTTIAWGLSESKIHAINRDLPDYDFDIIICWSQDMFAEFFGFDDIMREYILQSCEGLDHLIHFPEMDAKEYLNVLYIATRKYFDRFGYIYHPSYISLWCDNESMEVAKILGKYKYIGVPNLYIHKNPAYNHHNIQRDELFDLQQSYWGVDEANFNERMAKNFDLHLIENK